MKAERLLAILTILLNRKKVTASYLATRFGVSVRTIYRDVDALAGAGLPVFATQGRDGGFELVEGFTVSAQVLETGEIEQILTGLRSLKAVQPGQGLETVIEKFTLALKESGKRGIRTPGGHLFIELTPSRREKRILAELDESVAKRSVLKISYADAQGTESERAIEPEALVFMWQSWYAWAWCRLRADFRFFKISRILQTRETGERREGPATDHRHPATPKRRPRPGTAITTPMRSWRRGAPSRSATPRCAERGSSGGRTRRSSGSSAWSRS